MLRDLLAHALAALPPGCLPGLARLLAGLDRARGHPRWQRACEAYGLALAARCPAREAPLVQSCGAAWLDRLAALRHRARPGPAMAPPPGHVHPTLYLTGRVGQPHQLAQAARRLGLRVAGVECVPQRASHAAPTHWLGLPALRSTRALARALRRGADLRLLLQLPGVGLYASPSLCARHATPAQVLQHALDALALLARARPDLVDWSQPRGRLREQLARAGLPSWSRLAPWAWPRPGPSTGPRGRGRHAHACPRADKPRR